MSPRCLLAGTSSDQNCAFFPLTVMCLLFPWLPFNTLFLSATYFWAIRLGGTLAWFHLIALFEVF